MFEVQLLPRKLEAALVDVKDPKVKVRLSAVRDLVRHTAGEDAQRRQAVAGLSDALRDEDASVRAAACVAVADAGAAEASSAVRSLLGDGDEKVRQMALLALGEVGATDAGAADAVRPFLRAAQPALRFQALHAFSLLAGSRGQKLAVLTDGVGDVDADVRHLSVRLLDEEAAQGGALPDAAQKRLKAALSDDAAKVRTAAAVALPGKKLGARGRKVLVEAVSASGRLDLGEELGQAMKRCGELDIREAIPALDKRAFSRFRNDGFTFHARVALARMGHEKAKAVIAADLRSWNRDRRNQGVVAAGQARMREAVPRLEGMRHLVDPGLLDEALALIAGSS